MASPSRLLKGIPPPPDKPLPPRIPPPMSDLLKDGDLLFRYVDKYDLGNWAWEVLRTRIYDQIAKVQESNNVWDDVAGDWASCVDGCIFHVGIYTKTIGVIEILKHGLETHKIGDRDNYDIVVRIRNRGRTIADNALEAHLTNPPGGIKYPLIREGIVECKDPWYGHQTEPGAIRYRKAEKQREVTDQMKESIARKNRIKINTGGRVPSQAQHDLWNASRKSWGGKGFNKFTRMPVCSHFAAMMLYLARDLYCTLEAVSSADFDYIFKMTPSHLLHQAYLGLYMCEGAEVLGMQHKGRMIRAPGGLPELMTNAEEYARGLGFKPQGTVPHAPLIPEGGFHIKPVPPLPLKEGKHLAKRIVIH